MRLREFSCLLDIEVPPPGRGGLPATVRLQATAKYGLPRDVMIQHPTLREIDLYRRTERAAVIRRSAAALARRREELFVVSDVDAAAMRLTGCLHGRRRVFRVEAMPAQLRRITVIEGRRGLEPMALLAGRGGRMLTKQRWEQVFATGYCRAVRIAAETVCRRRCRAGSGFMISGTRSRFSCCSSSPSWSSRQSGISGTRAGTAATWPITSPATRC